MALLSFVLCLLAAPAAFSQIVTTSSLNGSISNDQRQPVAEASITVTHEPTGASYTLKSRADGSFSLSGLRPGGPYKVVVTSEGFAPYENGNVYLAIDRGADLAVHLLGADVVQLEKMDVTANAMDQLFDASQTGSGSFLSNKDISGLPAGDRSINALARLDPRVTYNRDPSDRAISVNGVSNRYNQIQVDGVNASDPFGLNANNTAAERNVIPLDSLEALSINTSPYNARNAGFVGAQINAITKSGTNEFKGSAYYTYRSQSMSFFGEELSTVGQYLDDTYYGLGNFREQTFGATLGGPIIPKKLFFYLAYEKVKENKVSPSPTTRLDDATTKQIADQATALGLKPGSATPPDGNKLKDDNLLAKLDWQINANHRASFRFNNVESSRPTFPGFSTGAGQNNFSFDSSWYAQETKNTSYIGQLISRWSDSLNTELSISHSKYHSEPKNNSRQPYVEIRNVPVTGSSNTAYVSMGTEYSRHFNVLDVKTDTIELFGAYQLSDKHTLQSGIQYDTSDTYNAYVQYAYGYYIFNSLSDFLNKAAAGGATGGATAYRYNALATGVDPAANFSQGNAGLFINDHWRLLPTLTVDVGVRVDMPVVPDDIPYNAAFATTFGVRNDYTYNNKKILQPRVGFNWQPALSKRTTIRGGAGLFYGRMPNVWLSNSYSNTGFNYVTYQATTLPAFSADPAKQPTSGTAPAQTVAYLDSGFQLPSRWKANLAVERELGFWDLKATAEAEGTWVRKDVFYENSNLVSTGTGPDGRVLYWDKYTATASGTRLFSKNFSNRIMKLANTDSGSTQAYTLSVERPLKKDGWSWKASYVNTHVQEVMFGTSSVAASNWNNRSIFNTNAQETHRGELEIRDRILINLSKEFTLIGKNKTTIDLLYDGHSGLPFSLAYNGDANGDSQSGNDLLYVPKQGENKVRFATAADETLFYQIVDRFGLTQGQTVQACSLRYPWVNTFDLSLKQEVKLPGWKHKLVVSLDFLNIGNMLNNKWGIIRGSNQFFVKRENVATVVYDGVAKQYVYSKVNSNLANGSFAPSLGRGEPAASRWSMLFTARYEF